MKKLSLNILDVLVPSYGKMHSQKKSGATVFEKTCPVRLTSSGFIVDALLQLKSKQEQDMLEKNKSSSWPSSKMREVFAESPAPLKTLKALFIEDSMSDVIAGQMTFIELLEFTRKNLLSWQKWKAHAVVKYADKYGVHTQDAYEVIESLSVWELKTLFEELFEDSIEHLLNWDDWSDRRLSDDAATN